MRSMGRAVDPETKGKRMIDGMKFYEKSKLKDGDFVKVKGNQLKFYEYTLAGEVNLDCELKKLSVLTTGL